MKILTGSRVRRIQKMFYNFQVTILCGFVTILVLRGTIGAGRFGTPAQDFTEIRNRLPGAQRTMMEFKVNKVDGHDRNLKAEISGLYDRNFDAVKYFDPSTVHHILGEAVTDWDEQRAEYIMKNGGRGNLTESGKPRILLVSGSQPKPCDNQNGDYLILKNLKNKIDYCRLHGIEVFFNMAHLDMEMSGFWAKLPLIRKLMLAHPDVEWIWWMDSDAFFTDMLFELPMEKYEDYNLVLHGWDDMLYKQKSWIGLNTGSFLIRNCQWSLDILDSWAPFGPIGKPRTEAGKLLTKHLVGRPDFEADDQSALIYLLITQKERWAEKTYLENSFYLHGYWVILVESFEKMMEEHHPGLGDERWPFVTHFVGCKPCHGSSGDYTSERCTTQMERAFNFADNQVLQVYGFHHPDLENHQVKKTILSQTDTPKFLRGDAPKFLREHPKFL
jgi:xyloglucan 6-xylosyltransferase